MMNLRGMLYLNHNSDNAFVRGSTFIGLCPSKPCLNTHHESETRVKRERSLAIGKWNHREIGKMTKARQCFGMSCNYIV